MNSYEEITDYVLEASDDFKKFLSDHRGTEIIGLPSLFVPASVKLYGGKGDKTSSWGVFAKENDFVLYAYFTFEYSSADSKVYRLAKHSSLIRDGVVLYSNLLRVGHGKVPVNPESFNHKIIQEYEAVKKSELQRFANHIFEK